MKICSQEILKYNLIDVFLLKHNNLHTNPVFMCLPLKFRLLFDAPILTLERRKDFMEVCIGVKFITGGKISTILFHCRLYL